MKDNIYTIPISEVFEPMQGCPLCGLASILEERWVDYIIGAAMMEPDVRVETNAHGFCGRHFDMMLERRNRLSVALLLQTRLARIDEIFDSLSSQPAGFFRKSGYELPGESCFICFKTDSEFLRILHNIAVVWEKEEDFRELYSKQEYLCHSHSVALMHTAPAVLRGKTLARFRKDTAELSRKRLRKVKADIDSFCNMFDYRNAGAETPSPEVEKAIENAAGYLTGKGKGR